MFRPEEDQDEGALVAAARAGDEGACSALFRRHAPRVLRMLRGFSSLSGQQVDDVTQETFIRAFSNLPRLRQPDRFGYWVLAIARRQALLSFSSNTRRSEREAEFLQETLLLAEAPGEEEEQRAVEVVRELIAALPEGPEKQTITRFYVQGDCSASELAKEMGVQKGTVTARLSRFRARVKRRLAALLAREDAP